MKALFSIGPLLILLSGIVPVQHLEVWLAGAPVCRMACAGTEYCCCKKRLEARKKGRLHRETRPTVTESAGGPHCPDNCAVPSAGQRMPTTRTASRVETTRPAVRDLLDTLPPVSYFNNRLNGPTHPRAPPA